LTLLPDAITSLRWRCPYTNFYQFRDTAHAAQFAVSLSDPVTGDAKTGSTSRAAPIVPIVPIHAYTGKKESWYLPATVRCTAL
jgi:hypothetical protein